VDGRVGAAGDGSGRRRRQPAAHHFRARRAPDGGGGALGRERSDHPARRGAGRGGRLRPDILAPEISERAVGGRRPGRPGDHLAGPPRGRGSSPGLHRTGGRMVPDGLQRGPPSRHHRDGDRLLRSSDEPAGRRPNPHPQCGVEPGALRRRAVAGPRRKGRLPGGGVGRGAVRPGPRSRPRARPRRTPRAAETRWAARDRRGRRRRVPAVLEPPGPGRGPSGRAGGGLHRALRRCPDGVDDGPDEPLGDAADPAPPRRATRPPRRPWPDGRPRAGPS
jgi:hypothetical protein